MKPPAKAGKPVGNETVEVPTIQLTPIRPSVVESTSAIPSNALHLLCKQKSMQNDADLFGFHVGSWFLFMKKTIPKVVYQLDSLWYVVDIREDALECKTLSMQNAEALNVHCFFSTPQAPHIQSFGPVGHHFSEGKKLWAKLLRSLLFWGQLTCLPAGIRGIN